MELLKFIGKIILIGLLALIFEPLIRTKLLPWLARVLRVVHSATAREPRLRRIDVLPQAVESLQLALMQARTTTLDPKPLGLPRDPQTYAKLEENFRGSCQSYYDESEIAYILYGRVINSEEPSVSQTIPNA